MKTCFRSVLVCVLLAVFASGTTALRAAPPVDPLAGNWLYMKDQPVTFNPDGTAEWKGKWHGTWEYLHNPEVQRHYRIVWEHGKSIDALALSEDGLRAHVRNDTGERQQYDVRRAIPDKPAPVQSATGPATAMPVDAADPIVGRWAWNKNERVTFQADGTARHSHGGEGTWALLHTPGAQRQYRLTWKSAAIDEIVCSEDGRSAQIRNNAGAQFGARRLSNDAPAAGPASAGPGAAEGADPIIGEWRWLKNRRVIFKADGTVTASNGPQGTWEFLQNPDTDRKYRLTWNQGKYVDDFSLNRATQTAHVVNQSGEEYNVARQGAASDEKTTPGKPGDYFGVPRG